MQKERWTNFSHPLGSHSERLCYANPIGASHTYLLLCPWKICFGKKSYHKSVKFWNQPKWFSFEQILLVSTLSKFFGGLCPSSSSLDGLKKSQITQFCRHSVGWEFFSLVADFTNVIKWWFQKRNISRVELEKTVWEPTGFILGIKFKILQKSWYVTDIYC